MIGASNGWYKGTQVFACPDRKAVFVPFSHIAADARFDGGAAAAAANGHNGVDALNGGDFGDMECPVVEGYQSPVKVTDVAKVSGINKGIQGHQNSCYLDATLFAMFSFTR
jgi:ubiquitin thioesterase CYLD